MATSLCCRDIIHKEKRIMLCSMNQRLDDTIVTIIATQGPQTTKQLRAILRQSQRITDQGVYRTLRALLRDGVLIRHRTTYRLSSLWQQEFLSLAGAVQQAEQPVRLLPKSQKLRTRWRLSQFHRAHALWEECILAALRSCHDPLVLISDPHPWMLFTHQSMVQRLRDALFAYDATLYRVILNRYNLDKVGTVLLKHSPQEHCYLATPHDDCDTATPNTAHVVVIDDYIISLELPTRTAAHIDALFADTEKESTTLRDELLPLVEPRQGLYVTCTKDRVKATQIRRRYTTLFGPLRHHTAETYRLGGRHTMLFKHRLDAAYART